MFSTLVSAASSAKSVKDVETVLKDILHLEREAITKDDLLSFYKMTFAVNKRFHQCDNILSLLNRIEDNGKYNLYIFSFVYCIYI